ncbi:hypothetical protein [Kingella oralis]
MQTPPTDERNFFDACRYLIKEIKKEIRKKLNPDDWENYDLHHVSPKFSEIVNLFIKKENIEKSLGQYITANSDIQNSPPKFTDITMKQKFIDFYNETYSDHEKQYELKPRK